MATRPWRYLDRKFPWWKWNANLGSLHRRHYNHPSHLLQHAYCDYGISIRGNFGKHTRSFEGADCPLIWLGMDSKSFWADHQYQQEDQLHVCNGPSWARIDDNWGSTWRDERTDRWEPQASQRGTRETRRQTHSQGNRNARVSKQGLRKSWVSKQHTISNQKRYWGYKEPHCSV